MKNNRALPYDDGDPRWIEPQQESVGPQGAALILELERLRTAFDRPDPSGSSRKPRRSGRDDGRAMPRQRNGQQKRRKSSIGRAIDVCLIQLGLNAPAPAGQQRSEVYAPRTPAPAPRRQSPRIAPDGPTPLDVSRLAPPERLDRDVRLPPRPAPANSRQLAVAPRNAPALPRPEVASPGRQLATIPPRPAREAPKNAIATLGDRMTAGVAFLVNRDGLAQVEMPGEALEVGVGRAFEHELRIGLRVLIAGVVMIGGWAGFVPLSAAVTVPGSLVVQSNVKAIQHPTGGVVAEIAVQNGMRVEAGQLLVRLDATQARSTLLVLSKQLDDIRVRMARLLAERDALPQPEIPPDMVPRAADPGVKAILASEQSQFIARTNARQSQKELLQSRVAQLGEQITGLDAQIKSKDSQIDLITGELKGVQDLYDKRLVPLTRLTTLQRESARIDGERGQLQSTIAETKAKIGEAQLQIVKLDQDFRTEVVKELTESQGKEAELAEHKVAAKDLLDRIELRAPTSGIVNQLAVHTIGGVIRSGDTIMEIVPDSDELQIEARIPPKDINDVKMGQTTYVNFSALNQRTTPKVIGVVSYVSADTSADKQTGTPAYTVRVTVSEEERRRLDGAQLVPGMPAELSVQSGSHTMLSYLFKPINEQLSHAFIER
jgi:membrane fusion protein, type I secretion system